MKQLIASIFSLLLVLLLPIQTFASDSVAYKTETLSGEGEVIETQTAYIQELK